MSKKTTVVRTCDNCHLPINKGAKYVAAEVYGADVHSLCWTKIGGPAVAKLLGLDEVEWAIHDGTDAPPETTGHAWAYVQLNEPIVVLNPDEVDSVTTEGIR